MAKNKKKTTEPKGEGRPLKPIDFSLVDKLCSIQCTGEEIASVVGVDYDTLERRIKTEFDCSFTEYFEAKRGAGKASLRRMQWKAAESGSNAMLIWLGKQYLGQKDKQDIDLEGSMGIQVIEIAPRIVPVPKNPKKK